MAALQMRKRHEKPPTSIYEDNYGYTINYYQPMIDYLDAKQRGVHLQYPHLPWSNERALSKYRPSNSVPKYTDQEIVKYSKEAYDHAKSRERDLEDYRIIKRTPLAVIKSAVGSRLLKHIHTSTIEDKTHRKLQEREDERRIVTAMEDIEHMKAKFNTHKDIELSQGLKSAIRGKTASQITAAILAESEKNIQGLKNEQNLEIETSRRRRGVSEARIIHRTAHFELIDDRMIDHLDTSVSSSLSDVKRQLHSFNQRSSDLYHDSRWRRKYLH